ncbi:MAG: hypothetical protein ACRDTM_10580 [Micromonosporaceae bacterium]
MEVQLASEASPDAAVNEDFAVAVPGFVAVLDGVTAPPGLDTGCVHNPAWYVRRLGTHLVANHSANETASPPELLAAAISAVRDDHGATCDLDHPGTPQSTVCLLRAGPEHADYLVLCDSPLVLDHDGRVEVITDRRHEQTSRQLREAAVAGGYAFGSDDRASRLRQLVTSQREHVNRPGGYWIAAANAAAAHHAVTGRLPLTGPARLRRAALLTDGASCAVEAFALMDWTQLLDVLAERGPAHLISLVRQAERSDAVGQRQPRHKRHDDATAAYCRFGGPPRTRVSPRTG